MAKYILILKGSFDIIAFDKYFLTRNKNNKDEVEYIWGGIVPEGGNLVRITFSKKYAKWKIHSSTKYMSENEIKKTYYHQPIEFINGNNRNINLTYKSPQSEDITINEERREYIVKYIDTQFKEIEFVIEGELQNRCKGDWFIDLSDEEIEKRMPPEDIKHKEKFKEIAKKIIEDFDKENKDNDFEFLDYMKIALWVHKNIKYDSEYIEPEDYSALDTYNARTGVCRHMTRLSNVLLYSLGYQVLYMSGYVCKSKLEFNDESRHAWSVIKIENKWYPFDSTWEIILGKLPVTHIFGKYFNIYPSGYSSTDGLKDYKGCVEGKYIE